jgi:hypothetical protein
MRGSATDSYAHDQRFRGATCAPAHLSPRPWGGAPPGRTRTRRKSGTWPAGLPHLSLGVGSLACWLALEAAALAPAARADADDYGPANRSWNGLSELVVVAREAGIEVHAGPRIDLAAVRPSDGMLLVYPRSPPPRADLTAFMLEGGRLALADDFGAGDGLLDSFRITRSAPGPVREERRLRGNRNVLVTRPRVSHVLVEGVSAVVVNHPQTLSHDQLDAILALDEQGGAVVLGGAVGKGRLVAIGDPSALINNMLEFRGNRAFAANLVRYLARDGRLWLATPDTLLASRYPGLRKTDPLASVRAALSKLGDVRLPKAALQLCSLVIALLLIGVGASALPRRGTYVRAVSLPAAETVAGLAGRVRYFARGRRNLLGPLLVYKLELEHALVEALGLRGAPSVRDVVGALRVKGVAPTVAASAERLLRDLDTLSLAELRTTAQPLVDAAKFRATVAAGDRILAALAARKSQG